MASIDTLPGIGQSYAKKLERLGIKTVIDLLHHYPKKYHDYTKIIPIRHLKAKVESAFGGTVLKKSRFYSRSGKLIDQAVIQDESGKIKISWFNSPYATKLIEEGQRYIFSGKPSFWGTNLTIVSPTITSVEKGTDKNLTPSYPLTEGVNSKFLRKVIKFVLNNIPIDDPVSDIASTINLPSLKDAYYQKHFPTNLESEGLADKRLAFNYHLQLSIKNLLFHKQLPPSPIIKIDPVLHHQFLHRLPFTLHQQQADALIDSFQDLTEYEFTNRLIHGETGSGKTVLAYLIAKHILENKYSFALLAPTQILANQHAATFQNLDPNLKIQLVTSTSPLQDIQNPTIFIGTHALMNQLPTNLKYPLAALVIDEQHRFGVKQRDQLLQRSPSPHLFNLSATPIPRTVALGLFGEIRISRIAQKANSQNNIKTIVTTQDKYDQGLDWLQKKLLSGKKIFIICPLIHPSKSKNLANVQETTKYYQKHFAKIAPIYSVHGQMKSSSINQNISKFKSERAAILISTTLIEVGIDIPQASIIVIHSAEAFGLAQLHQLRGRVGRDGNESYCILFPSKHGQEDVKRLALLQKYSSGLVLAKHDLKLRGAGELFGQKQHGFLPIRLKHFWSRQLYLEAKTIAKDLIKDSAKAQSLAQLLLSC